MRILADRNIPYVKEAFAPLGDVEVVSADGIVPGAVKDAELLLVRSTVRVDRALLEGSRVRFVGTATIGFDHLDLDALSALRVAWAAAPGSNAASVAQWWASALLTSCERRGVDPARLTIGIVGVGAVGSLIERFARALTGRAPLLCDPPRARREGGAFVGLDPILAGCDVVTLHVPLERTGEDATFRLLDARRLEAMRAGAWLVNASRGEVVDGEALFGALAAGRVEALLDVYPAEPRPSPELISRAMIATPHIAGHSLDGKAQGTLDLYRAACRFLDRRPEWQPPLPPPPAPVPVATAGLADAAIALTALRTLWRIEDDDAAMRRIVTAPDPARAFREYRSSYPIRREPKVLSVALAPPRASAAALLQSLGAPVPR